MPNKTINQLDLPADVVTGDFLPVWDASAATTNKIYINDVNNLPSIRYNNRFYDILVDRYAYLSGIIGGDTGLQTLKGIFTAIVGGQNNMCSGDYSTVGAGERVRLSGTHSFIGGGLRSVSSGIYSFLGGGQANTIAAEHTTLVGGQSNVASGAYSTIPGGLSNITRNSFTFAAGRQSIADRDGAFVFSDARGIDKVAVGGQNALTADFSGGCWITGGGLNARKGFGIFPTGDTPTSSIGGRSGDFAYKDDYLYIFTGDNADLSTRNWGRVKLSSLTAAAGGNSIVSNKSSAVIPGGSPYVCTTAFANVTHVADPWNPVGQDASITVPAGNFTYLFDCQFGIERGTLASNVHYRLWNATDSALIANTSGNRQITAASQAFQTNISTMVTLNYAASKTINLQVFEDVGASNNAEIVPTGGYLRWYVLE